ncbi:MAG: efflux RND transporter periplasmic adaptor subunit [Gemmataceae bacterium]
MDNGERTCLPIARNKVCWHRLVALCAPLVVCAIVVVPSRSSGQPGVGVVYVEPVLEREVRAGRTLVGTVTPLRQALVGSAVAGRVQEYLAEEGKRVRRGDVLARLQTGVVAAEVELARAQLKLRQSELEELLNGSRKEEVQQARAHMENMKALMQYRQNRLERARAARLGTSPEELDEALSLAQQAEAAYREAHAAWRLIEEGPRRERIDQARARAQAQAAELQRLEEIMARFTLVAPFDGYVIAEHAEVGKWLNPGDPVAEVAALDEVDVEVPVPEDDVVRLKISDTARVEIPALGASWSGRIVSIVPQAHVRSRTFPVKVRLANRLEQEAPVIKGGMFARVTFSTGNRHKALLVHKDAIVYGGSAPVVYVIEQEGDRTIVRAVVVELGVAEGDYIEVHGAVRPGQEVVVQGNERLTPGQPVRVQPRTASPDRARATPRP